MVEIEAKVRMAKKGERVEPDMAQAATQPIKGNAPSVVRFDRVPKSIRQLCNGVYECVGCVRAPAPAHIRSGTKVKFIQWYFL